MPAYTRRLDDETRSDISALRVYAKNEHRRQLAVLASTLGCMWCPRCKAWWRDWKVLVGVRPNSRGMHGLYTAKGKKGYCPVHDCQMRLKPNRTVRSTYHPPKIASEEKTLRETMKARDSSPFWF